MTALFVEFTGAGETPKADEELLEGELPDWVGAGFNGLPGIGASGLCDRIEADSPGAGLVVCAAPADGDELEAGSSTAAAAGTAATSGRERSIR
ncbi:MAG TPA: hypothetical protein VN699_04990 [Pirellulales bacterium]|nr:hypothetical protein [Pirellulales bacterium]